MRSWPGVCIMKVLWDWNPFNDAVLKMLKSVCCRYRLEGKTIGNSALLHPSFGAIKKEKYIVR